MNDANSISHTITRVLLISPEQNELLRRNHSRVFIYPQGEGLIDALIFQSCRRLDDFIPDVQRAIEMSGLEDASGANQLSVTDSPNISGGMMQKHIITNGWLKIDHTVYDMVLEVSIHGEALPSPEITTMSVENASGENPLIILTGIESFSEGYYNQPDEEPSNVVSIADRAPAETGPTEEQAETMLRRVARQAQSTDNDSEDASGRMAGRPGRVKNPLLDGRLKQNRLARRSQEGEAAASGTKGAASA